MICQSAGFNDRTANLPAFPVGKKLFCLEAADSNVNHISPQRRPVFKGLPNDFPMWQIT